MTAETTGEKVHPGPWKGGRLTASALAVVERQWQTGELHPEAGRLRIKDTDVRGLELRLSRTGARSWAVTRRMAGRQRRFTIENSSAMPLAEARKAAEQLKADTGKGIDPIEEKRKARAEAKAAIVAKLAETRLTLAQVLDAFGRTAAKGQRSWPVRRETIASEYRRHLDRPTADLTEQDVLAVLDAATARNARVQGFHGHRYLRQVLAWAVEEDKIISNVAAGIARKRLLGKVGPPKPRHRVLSTSELRKIWLALAAQQSDYARIYQMVLLTAQRPGEVATMRWADLDLDNQLWTQPTTKSDRPHTVPLSDAAVAILRAQRPDEGGVAPLFPSPRVFNSLAGGELGPKSGNWGRFSKRVMEATATSAWTRHDLRRTSATLMAESRVDRGTIELLLNHSESAGKGGLVASIYNRYSYEAEKRAAVEALAARIESIATGSVTSDGNVIELRPAKAAAG